MGAVRAARALHPPSEPPLSAKPSESEHFPFRPHIEIVENEFKLAPSQPLANRSRVKCSATIRAIGASCREMTRLESPGRCFDSHRSPALGTSEADKAFAIIRIRNSCHCSRSSASVPPLTSTPPASAPGQHRYPPCALNFVLPPSHQRSWCSGVVSFSHSAYCTTLLLAIRPA